MIETPKPRTPQHIRDGVKEGVLASIMHDVERRGGRTARLLAAAGVLGVVGSVGATLLVSRHPFGHHPPWHVAVVSALWAGLLIVSLAINFLRVRTAALPLSQAAGVGVLGLGLAGICGAICPDQHFLYWWSGTSMGGPISEGGGPALGALCFGLVATLFIGVISALVLTIRDGGRSIRPLLPASVLLGLLAPGIALQSYETSWVVFGAWIIGAGLGAYLGVAAGFQARALFRTDST